MKKILVVGITGTRNRGVEALLVTLVDGIRRRIPSCEISVLTDDVEFDKRHCRALEVDFIPSVNFRTADLSLYWLAKIGIAMERVRGARHQRVFAAVRECDLVVISGGDMLTSDYGSRSLRNALSWTHVGHALGKKVVALGQSIGPFTCARDRKLWRRAQTRLELITFREKHSHDLLRKDGLLDLSKVRHVADSAFLLPTLQGAIRRRLLEFYQLDQGTYVALAVSAGIAKYRKGDSESHRAVLLGLIERFLRAGRRVLLVPHVSERSPNNDDSFLAAELVRETGFDGRVRVAASGHSAIEYKTLIAGAAFAVAERMHAAIASLSTGVPVLVVGYSVKARGILSAALGDTDLVDCCLVDFESFVRSETAAAQVDRFEANAAAIAEVLAGAEPRLRKEAESNFAPFTDLLAK